MNGEGPEAHSSSVQVNGHPEGTWIQPTRGIRQGCPLALLLFVIAVDGHAISTTQACSHSLLRRYQMPTLHACIPLLQYANDITFFMKGLVEEVRNLSTIMEIFSECSGLHLNCAKSTYTRFDYCQRRPNALRFRGH